MKYARGIGLIVVVAISASAAERDDASSCLSSEQRGELFRRIVEAVAVATIETRLATSGPRSEAVTARNNAKRALAACEEKQPSDISPSTDACASERGSLKSAAEAYAAASADERTRLRAKISERTRAIRAEYPNCGTIDR
jgi:hypothetical protein